MSQLTDQQFDQDNEINERLDILEIEYNKKIRDQEPNKNKYCRVSRIKNEKFYKFICGFSYPYEYWNLDSVTKEHLKSCNICKILRGSKRKTGLKQDEISKLFEIDSRKYDSYKTNTDNLRIDNNVLWHYRTIEAIKTIYGKIISNSQCYSLGFAECPRLKEDHSLPLTAINSIDIQDIKHIKILDEKQDKTLFRIFDKYYLTGQDDGQVYLVELIDKVRTVKAAIESMIPLRARNNKKYVRQGDLFFIETNKQFSQYEKQHYEDLPVSLDYQQEDQLNQEIKRLNKLLNVKSNYTQYEYYHDSTSRLVISQAVHKAYESIKPEKELKRLQIFDTNHNAQFRKIDYPKNFSQDLINDLKKRESLSPRQDIVKLYVKGSIYHTNREHKKLILDSWCLVKQNRVKHSYKVTFDKIGSGSGNWRYD